jgi:hypothetical protein
VTVGSQALAPPAPRIAVHTGKRQFDRYTQFVDLQIHNAGEVNLKVGKISIEGWEADRFVLSGSCGVIPAETTCTLSIKLKGRSHNADLVILSNDPDQPVLILPIGKSTR